MTLYSMTGACAHNITQLRRYSIVLQLARATSSACHSARTLQLSTSKHITTSHSPPNCTRPAAIAQTQRRW